jgi:hypothetical protein
MNSADTKDGYDEKTPFHLFLVDIPQQKMTYAGFL